MGLKRESQEKCLVRNVGKKSVAMHVNIRIQKHGTISVIR